MRRAFVLAVFVILCLTGSAEARTSRLSVGIGEQNPRIFSDQHWLGLHRQNVRYVMSWDALRDAHSRAEVHQFMTAAHIRHARVFLSFGHSSRVGRELKLPSVRAFRRAFKAFRHRYPWVKTFETWNEANHGTQPTRRKPAAAARFFDALESSCRRCTITSPSVLDDGMKTIRWIRRFRRAAKHRVTIWSLHNHIDVNRNRVGRSSSTRLFLRSTRGQVWFSETGGIWNRWIGNRKIRRYTHRTAVRAIRNIFKLARAGHHRVRRVYVYNWFGPPYPRPRWDSGLVAWNGAPRPMLGVLKKQMRRYAR